MLFHFLPKLAAYLSCISRELVNLSYEMEKYLTNSVFFFRNVYTSYLFNTFFGQ